MTQGFAPRLHAYLEAARQARRTSPEHVRHTFFTFLRDALGIDLRGRLVEPHVARGFVDALLGDLVFEFRQDLEREGREAEEGLRRSARDLRGRRPGARLTAVATDGQRFRVYRPEGKGEALALEPLAEADLSQTEAGEARLFLVSLLAHLHPTPLPPEPETVRALFGPTSPSFRSALTDLRRMARALRDNPSYETRRLLWARHLAAVYGLGVEDEGLFLRHTYLALLARLMGAVALGYPSGPRGPEEPAEVLDGRWFRGRGLENAAEEDFFTWPLLEPVRSEGLALASALLQALGRVDLSRAPAGVLKGLYEDLVDPEGRHDLGGYSTPDWLAEWILGEELGLREHPEATVLDPVCGSGTFLSFALRLLRQAQGMEALPPDEVLFRLTHQVVGADVHPLAVAVARTHYLLALQDLLREEPLPLVLPVFLADTLRPPAPTPRTRGGPPSYTVPVDLGPGGPRLSWELPARAAEDAGSLLHLVRRMADEYAPALHALPEGSPRAQRVLQAFYAYLTAPKRAGAGMPLAFTPEEADSLVRLLRTYVRLVREGRNGLWAHLLGNTFAPVALHRSRFDFVVGNPPVEAATLFFARSADLYLKEGGRIAFVLPREALGPTARDRDFARGVLTDAEGRRLALRWERVMDLEGVSPLFGPRGGGPGTAPACVVVARKGEEPADRVPALRVVGDLPHRNAGLEEARRHLQMEALTLERRDDRWVPAGRPS